MTKISLRSSLNLIIRVHVNVAMDRSRDSERNRFGIQTGSRTGIQNVRNNDVAGTTVLTFQR